MHLAALFLQLLLSLHLVHALPTTSDSEMRGAGEPFDAAGAMGNRRAGADTSLQAKGVSHEEIATKAAEKIGDDIADPALGTALGALAGMIGELGDMEDSTDAPATLNTATSTETDAQLGQAAAGSVGEALFHPLGLDEIGELAGGTFGWVIGKLGDMKNDV
ncbi:hypothetical protein C8R44DRAFT_868846 [Mycena epipterygia]|nr:hypothetical protein C8R44DRAFT_868846 [Mycena epipterygia]